MKSGFAAPIARTIWEQKYRLTNGERGVQDVTVVDTFRRVAVAIAEAEGPDGAAKAAWADRFEGAIGDFGFLPAGRILAGAGSGRAVTLFNCFVIGAVPDDLGGIFDSVRTSALTLQSGGGIGIDFSTLRPRGAAVHSIGADASGPVSFMDVWDAMCRTIMSAGARRGAMMATLRADHPDIDDFITAKTTAGRLTNFNLSVLVPDALMEAVATDGDWPLVFNDQVYKTIKARDLWERIVRATYETSEPGVIFIDRVNALNNLNYCETIHATNPCGEQPLPAFGACLLGSINLPRLVEDAFSDGASIDPAKLRQRVTTAVRFLDNAIAVSRYPLPEQEREAHAKRRIGLGVTGLADALIMCGLHYDSDAARSAAASWMQAIQTSAYAASVELAREKGAFALFDRDAFLAQATPGSLPAHMREAIARHGIRNGCLTSIAPTGTISLFAGNVSSGIEPVFDFRYQRNVMERDGSKRTEIVEDYAYARYREFSRRSGNPIADESEINRDQLPASFVTATELSPKAHLAMQAAVQPYIDSAISKTINCPEDISFESFRSIYEDAYAANLKGCTTYRASAVRGAVLSPVAKAKAGQQTGIAGGAENQAVSQGQDQGQGQGDPASPSHGNSGDARPAEPPAVDGERVVYLSQPLERAPALAGQTYKLKWGGSDHAIYVTINDIEHDGRRRPFEIFINTKNLEHFAWMVALTRMISAVFRRGGDVSFVSEELKAIFDPQGGQWSSGRYVPSLQAAIGEVIEGHLRAIGFVEAGDHGSREAGRAPSQVARANTNGKTDAKLVRSPPALPSPSPNHARLPDQAGTQSSSRNKAHGYCAACGSPDLVMSGACLTCRACGFSKCD